MRDDGVRCESSEQRAASKYIAASKKSDFDWLPGSHIHKQLETHITRKKELRSEGGSSQVCGLKRARVRFVCQQQHTHFIFSATQQNAEHNSSDGESIMRG
eukprot:scaffold3577_cov262-Chaetoceros_neogracile.AAC.3